MITKISKAEPQAVNSAMCRVQRQLPLFASLGVFESIVVSLGRPIPSSCSLSVDDLRDGPPDISILFYFALRFQELKVSERRPGGDLVKIVGSIHVSL